MLVPVGCNATIETSAIRETISAYSINAWPACRACGTGIDGGHDELSDRELESSHHRHLTFRLFRFASVFKADQRPSPPDETKTPPNPRRWGRPGEKVFGDL